MDHHLQLSENASTSCRICFENDNPIDLISPCLCKGGSAYVHRKCLDNWRSLNENGRAFKFCDVCQFEYVIEPVIDDPSADRKRLRMFRLRVTCDIVLIILLLQAIIIGLTFVLQAADKESNDIKNLYPASMSAFGVYYLSSVILFFALLGLFGLIGSCCGLASSPVNNRSHGTCYPCFCSSPDCSGCDGGGEGAGIALIVIVLLFAILGVIIGITLGGIIINKVMKRHRNKLWLRQETKKYIVKDFQGRSDELTNISTQHPIINSSIHVEIDNDRTHKILSTLV